MSYVSKKKVIEKINGKYIHYDSPKLRDLMNELDETVDGILEKKDLTEYQSRQADKMGLTKNK